MDGDAGNGATRQSAVSGGAQAAKARASLKGKIVALRDAMLVGLVDRDEPVRLLLAAMLAGEHMLLVGPPGTAKSELARRLHGVVGGGYFERLLTRFSVPEELFGPLSLRELENDRYLRRVEGYLPSASVAFVDEIFKANSAILNSLLTVLNERLFDNGATREAIPLVSLVGASNELPKGDELSALYDRFLVRYQVGAVPPDRFAEMALATDAPWVAPPEHDRLTATDLDAIRDGARSLPVSPDVVDLLRGLREAAPGFGLAVSDRRWKKIVKLLRTVALVDGRDEVTRWDFWIVSHCVWSTPEQRPAVQEWYEKQLGVDASASPERTRRVIAAMSAELAHMQGMTDPVLSKKTGKPLYRGPDGSEREGPEPQQVKRGGQPLYLAPAKQAPNGDRTNGGNGYTTDQLRNTFHIGYYHDQLNKYLGDRTNWLMEAPATAVLQPRQHSAAEVADCVTQLAPAREAVDASLRDIGQRVREVDELLASHVIVPPAFRAPALAGLRANQAMLEAVRAELKALEDGFRRLPVRAERAAL